MEELEILEGRLARALAAIRPMDQEGPAAARRHWDAVAKPLNGLGQLEEVIARMAGTAPLKREVRKCVVPFCADNGVVAEGVTQTDSSVTAVVAGNMLTGAASVCCMGRVTGAAVLPVDAGMLTEVPGMRSIKVSRGTANLAGEPAMTRRQCLAVLLAGLELAGELAEEFDILAAGEMGIGNTTTSSAVASVLLREEPEGLTGRGAGLTGEGLRRKVAAIRRGIACNRPDPADPVEVLAKVGGFDIAAMAGFYLGASAAGVPVVLDGFISAVAALSACRLAPAAGAGMLASHCSGEPGARRVLDALGLAPVMTAGFCLGEGTGAVALLPLLDMAAAVYREMSTFGDIAVEAYRPLV